MCERDHRVNTLPLRNLQRVGDVTDGGSAEKAKGSTSAEADESQAQPSQVGGDGAEKGKSKSDDSQAKGDPHDMNLHDSQATGDSHSKDEATYVPVPPSHSQSHSQ